MEIISTKAFGAYDLRGIYPKEINEELAYRVGRCFGKLFGAEKVVVGNDIRLSGPAIKAALARGLSESGVEVNDIGQCGTEMVYFATAHLKAGGGVMITASHNPKDYNGMKLVREGARPISADTGLKDLAAVVNEELPAPAAAPGEIKQVDIAEAYIDHVLSYIDAAKLKPLTVVANAGNGAVGPFLDLVEKKLPVKLIKLFNEPDGTFPNGVPNPILVENRDVTSKAVVDNKADLGVAWDGDFDRCFFFDEKGTFLEGYYMVGYLAQNFLKKFPGGGVIYDPRVIWNTLDIVNKAGGRPILSKSGHAFIKERMRQEDAVYGGEMSAHHYFRDFSYCDSGMLPFLIVLSLLSEADAPLSAQIEERMKMFPCSGEINSTVADAKPVLDALEAEYGAMPGAEVVKIDGISVTFDSWRFNLRMSNTEPVIRLNVETKGDEKLLAEKTQELLAKIRG